MFAYHYAANAIDRDELVRIRDAQSPRGPDGVGLWLPGDGRIGFGHRRLAILDLSERGAQPFISDDGRYALTFNGEIYNYRQLRAQLIEQGIRFKSDSDTEVLLHLLAREGVAALTKLRGMYSLGFWDVQTQRLLLARDPYGIKPLYYADDGWTLRFASQVKALLASPQVSRDPEPAGHVGFFLLGSVPEPYTLYREIRALPAGHYLWVDSLGAQPPQLHASLAASLAEAGPADDDEVLVAKLREAVGAHLIADVPVGLFLSAGVDSGALLGLMRDAGAKQVQAVTLAFAEYEGSADDEAPLAAAVARHYGAGHRVERISRSDLDGDCDAFFTSMDQPSIDGLNSWFVSKAARAGGLKVALSGVGGDELLGGYPTFRDVPRWARSLALPAAIPGAGWLWRQLASQAGDRLSPKLAGMLTHGGTEPGAWLLKRGLFLPEELPGLLGPELAREGLRRLQLHAHLRAPLQPRPSQSFARVALLEAGHYLRNQLLRDSDWASMAHGLELRTPLVDFQLFQAFAGRLREGRLSKALLATAPRTALPEVIRRRAKTGFTTPIAQWLQQNPALDAWRAQPALAAAHTPWARRWAWIVYARLAAPA